MPSLDTRRARTPRVDGPLYATADVQRADLWRGRDRHVSPAEQVSRAFDTSRNMMTTPDHDTELAGLLRVLLRWSLPTVMTSGVRVVALCVMPRRES